MASQTFSNGKICYRIAFVLAILLINPIAQGKELSEYWAETKLEINHLFNDQHVSFENCMKNENNFLGCLSALESLVNSSQPGPHKKDQPYYRVISKIEYEKFPSNFTPMVPGQKHDLLVVEVKNEAVDPAAEKKLTIEAAVAEARKLREASLQSRVSVYKKWLKQKDQAATQFSSLMALAKTKLKSATNQPEALADALNNYFVSAEDPHTSIRPTQQLIDKQRAPNTDFVGVGVEFTGGVPDGVLVSRVFRGSGAEQAGIKRGDVITHVGEVQLSKANLSVEELVNLIRGQPETQIQLQIRRVKTSFTVMVRRSKLVARNLELEGIGSTDTPMAYLHLREFSSMQDCFEIRAALAFVESKGVKGVILDLRRNPGGLTRVAMCILSSFLDAEALLAKGQSLSYEVNIKTGARTEFLNKENLDEIEKFLNLNAQRNNIKLSHVSSLPLVVLVDNRSASSSEIVSGTLQDYDRAWIVGLRTFGKGTAQSGRMSGWNGLPSVVKTETQSRYYLPSGRTPQVAGVEADFVAMENPSQVEIPGTLMREETLYTNAIPPLGPKWQSRRPAALEKMNGCLKTHGQAENVYKQFEANGEQLSLDYQLMKAQDVLWCQIHDK